MKDFITMEWLLSIGAEPSAWLLDGTTKKEVAEVCFEGKDWYLYFQNIGIPELGVGVHVGERKQMPHLTTKAQFRALYELLEGKKLVENS